MSETPSPAVVSLHRSASHSFSKEETTSATFIAGLGLEGDIHSGAMDQHLSRQKDPRPNLRQVHLLPIELYEQLNADGYALSPGGLGENLVTRGISLNDVPAGTTLTLGDDVIIALTGLRDPCAQIDKACPGARAAVAFTSESGKVLFKHGAMAVVVRGGVVRAGDAIGISYPAGPAHRLEKV